MDLNITSFFNNECPRDYCASVAELGPTAGRDTWQAALDNAPDFRFVTNENRDEVEHHFLAYGAWTNDELVRMTNDELCAMLIQDISGAMRDAGAPGKPWDWEAYEAGCENCTYSGRLYRNGNDVFFSLD